MTHVGSQRHSQQQKKSALVPRYMDGVQYVVPLISKSTLRTVLHEATLTLYRRSADCFI
jgi:hypothetical protein